MQDTFIWLSLSYRSGSSETLNRDFGACVWNSKLASTLSCIHLETVTAGADIQQGKRLGLRYIIEMAQFPFSFLFTTLMIGSNLERVSRES